jgi:hypothetical protein
MDARKTNENKVEVRFFGQLQELAKEKGWTFPSVVELEGECSALQLAERMGIATDQIEAVFIDGVAKPIDEGMVKPGCRIGFIPYGVPGPYRVLLGIRKLKEPE